VKCIDEILLEHKMLIVNLLYDRGIFSEHKVNAIMSFLKNYVRFKKPETNRNERVDQKTGKKNTMGIIEQLAEMKAGEALEKGMKKGMKKGREEGNEKAVKLLLDNTEFSAAKIAELVGVPVSFVKKVKGNLQPKLQAK
jgi:flagellar biosynthesis/type III secretory pathway protein FliH